MFAALQRVTLVFSTYLPTYTNWLCVKVLEYDIFHTAAYIRVVYLVKIQNVEIILSCVCIIFGGREVKQNKDLGSLLFPSIWSLLWSRE